MSVKTSAFASQAERKNYKKLTQQWSNYNIYHNLPFLNIFELKDLFDWKSKIPFTLSQEDERSLKKTSIDYTVCDLNDNPIIRIM